MRIRSHRPFIFLLAALAGCSSSAVSAADSGAVGQGVPGQTCKADGDCQSGACLGSNCCAAPCRTAPGHPQCSYCDTAGACQYPPALCQAAACDPLKGQATPDVLCSGGTCPVPAPTACSGACQGNRCGDGCLGDQDCVSGYTCVNAGGANASAMGSKGYPGTCVPQGKGGASCLTNDDCLQGNCIGGLCCNSPCTQDPLHPECTACDASGSCVYPSVACSAPQCDPQTNALLPAATCQAGSCQARPPVGCGTYLCTVAGCTSSCLVDADCSGSSFCAAGGAGQTCCPVVIDGATINVDLAVGSDQSCCGASGSPCRTIAGALAVAALSKAKDAEQEQPLLAHYVLHLAFDGGGGDWQLPPPHIAGDSFPLTVPAGVTLYGPGITLGTLQMGDNSGPVIGLDGGYAVTLRGDPNAPLTIGLRTANDQLDAASTFIGGGSLNLSNVRLFGGLLASTLQSGQALALNLGLDERGNSGGTVQIGWDPSAGRLNGATAPATPGLMVISLSSAATPVTLTDFGPPGQPVLKVFNTAAASFSLNEFHSGSDYQSYDYTGLGGVNIGYQVSAQLTHAPLFGGSAADGYGGEVGLVNAGSLLLSGATVANQRQAGIVEAAGPLTIAGSTIKANGCAGVVSDPAFGAFSEAFGGVPAPTGPAPAPASTRISATVVTSNYLGIYQAGGAIDLSHGADGGPGGDQVTCNGLLHQPKPAASCPYYVDGGVGADVWNGSNQLLAAATVAWGPKDPTLWICSFLNPQKCGNAAGPDCSGANCQDTILEAVTSSDAGAIDLSSPSTPVTSCP